jgi:hypothetical protein
MAWAEDTQIFASQQVDGPARQDFIEHLGNCGHATITAG